MKLATIAIAEATDRQLLDYCRTFLQIETSAQALRDTILSKIEAAMPGITNITALVDGDDLPEHNEAPPVVSSNSDVASGKRFDIGSSNDPRVVITIHEQTGQGNFGKRAVPVSVNGRTMLIPRGIEANIPYRFYLALNNAKETGYDDVQDERDRTQVERQETNAHSYPFSVVVPAPKAEVEAWFKSKEKEQADAVLAADKRRSRAIGAAIAEAASAEHAA